MDWYRVDNRLIHGQVIETWLPYTRATKLVVCSDALAADSFRQQILLLAVPSHIGTNFVTVVDLPDIQQRDRDRGETLFVLFPDCINAQKSFALGVNFKILNIGNLHYGPGKLQICPHVALDADDVTCLAFLKEQGVTFDFRCVPNDYVLVREWQ